MYKLFFTVVLCSFTIIHAAPTSIDKTTLRKNGEEAQALNQQFKTFKTTDTCTDGQSACVGNAIGKCQGTTWDITRGKCSKSQSCFALPSISNEGTTLTCTTEEAAAKSIEAAGANGGVFGQPSNKDAMSSTSEATSPAISSSEVTNRPEPTIAPDLPTLTASAPGTEESDRVSESESDTDSPSPHTHQYSTFSVPTATSTSKDSDAATITPAPVPSTDTNTTLEGTTITQITISPSRPSGTGQAPEIVTVTVTFSPSEPMTLAPQTRTLSPEEASSVISSILAANRATTSSPSTTPTDPSPAVSPVDATELPESESLPAIPSSTVYSTSGTGKGYGY